MIFITILAQGIHQNPSGGCCIVSNPCTAEAGAVTTGAQNRGLPVLQSYTIPPLPVDNQSKAKGELLNLTFWKDVGASSDKTLIELVPNMWLGYLNNSKAMTEWTLQLMHGAPSWVTTGPMAAVHGQFIGLQNKVTSTGDTNVAMALVRHYIANQSGRPLAAIDFVIGGGVSAIKADLDTKSVTLAQCATFPAQLAQLFIMALDSSISSDQRAKYLGQALAISSVTAVLAGKDAFDIKFETALRDAGLLDAWPTMKPLLANIAKTVSLKAVALTLSVVEKVAKRFPQDSWAAGFTIDRIDSMTEVLHEKGFTNDAIEQKIAGLIQAADGSPSPDGVGNGADAISYDDGGGLRVKLTTQNRLFRYTDKETMMPIDANFLAQRVPGFKEGATASLKVYYWEKGVTVYHYYEGGDNWYPTVPDGFANTGDVLTITVQVLTKDDFVKNLPRPTLANEIGMRWMSDLIEVKGYSLTGDEMKISFSQDPEVEGVSNFVIEGTASGPLQFKKGLTYLDLDMKDTFGNVRAIRISHDGFGPLSLGLESGGKFAKLTFLSYDGLRLRVLYQQREFDTTLATIYVGDPATLYTLGASDSYAVPSDISGVSSALKIEGTTLNRPLENVMLQNGPTYDAGRIGAEIAYAVAKEKLGLQDVVMNEPAKLGTDLYTKDGSVKIQARMLTATKDLSSQKVEQAIHRELSDLRSQLQNDFDNHPEAKTGYLILSYVDNDGVIKTIVLEVPRP